MYDLIFVYGSLKKGYSNYHYLENSEFVGPGITQEADFDMLSVGDAYPALVAGKYHAVGELFWVDEDTLVRMDRLEGALYERKQIKVNLFSNNALLLVAWVYIYIHPYTTEGGWSHYQSERIIRSNSVVEWK